MAVFGKREREKKKITESVNTVLIKHENYTLSASYIWNLNIGSSYRKTLDWMTVEENVLKTCLNLK